MRRRVLASTSPMRSCASSRRQPPHYQYTLRVQLASSATVLFSSSSLSLRFRFPAQWPIIIFPTPQKGLSSFAVVPFDFNFDGAFRQLCLANGVGSRILILEGE